MTDTPLTTDRILDAAEEVLRRYGPAKTTVVDVARALDVSHGTIYRHYPSKAALRDAVVQRWLHGVCTPLETQTQTEIEPVAQLRGWLDLLIGQKRRRLFDDPELFALYDTLAQQAGAAVEAHVAELTDQLARIIARGAALGVFHVPDARRAARAILYATARFHHPVHASEWHNPAIDAEFDEVWRLLLVGLTKGEG